MARTAKTNSVNSSTLSPYLEAPFRIQTALLRASFHWFEEAANFGAVIANRQMEAVKRIAACNSPTAMLDEQAALVNETIADFSEEMPRLYSISREAFAETKAA